MRLTVSVLKIIWIKFTFNKMMKWSSLVMHVLVQLVVCAKSHNTSLKELVFPRNISWHYLPLEAVHLCSVLLLLQHDTQQKVESGISGAESDSWRIVDSSLLQALQRRLAVLILQHVPCGHVKTLWYMAYRQQDQRVFPYICLEICINIEQKNNISQWPYSPTLYK